MFRVADVGKQRLTVFPTRLDEDVACANHALDNRLVEADVVDFAHRDFDAVSGNDARAINDALISDHEMHAAPLQCVYQQHDERDAHKCQRGIDGDGFERGEKRAGGFGGDAIADHHEGKCADEFEGGFDECPPMRVEIEDHDFAFVEILLRIAHQTIVMCGV